MSYEVYNILFKVKTYIYTMEIHMNIQLFDIALKSSIIVRTNDD